MSDKSVLYLFLTNRRMIADTLLLMKILNNSIDYLELLENNNFHVPKNPDHFDTTLSWLYQGHLPIIGRTTIA